MTGPTVWFTPVSSSTCSVQARPPRSGFCSQWITLLASRSEKKGVTWNVRASVQYTQESNAYDKYITPTIRLYSTSALPNVRVWVLKTVGPGFYIGTENLILHTNTNHTSRSQQSCPYAGRPLCHATTWEHDVEPLHYLCTLGMFNSHDVSPRTSS